jgi:uncharacterized repeat protein (TIGR03803 family)
MNRTTSFARSPLIWIALVLFTTTFSAAQSNAQATFRVIAYMHQFGPAIGITEASPGVFLSAGGQGDQFAFSITPQGAITTLAKFPTGYNLHSALVAAGNGKFYSSIELSLNPPTVFSVRPTPMSKHVYPPQQFAPSFTANAPDGTLLGIGFGPSNLPYLVKTDPNGVVTPIHQFPAGTRLPNTAIYGIDGNYYGVYYLHDGSGSVYRVTPAGSFAKILTFPVNSFLDSDVALLQSRDGNLYGATTTGGANGTGTIYKLTLSGQFTPLYEFPKGAVASPTELIEASDGNLYGSTFGTSSTLFRVTKTGQYTLLHAMNAYLDGQCECHLIQGCDGTIYGTTMLGGVPGVGDVFALNAGLPKPAPWPQTFEPQSGPAGTRVRIWGADLLAASVQFNGVASTGVSNSGSSYIWATVPQGAVTGPITVTTPGGVYTTQAFFTVQ